ncbi:MAG: ribonuclease E/G [Inquilinus sp.]|nr:ribonuclease E/G [Inquilinus sp.]
MAKRMLVDATHPEETRVVVVDGNRLEEFDFESASRKQLKGNIYLAKVTRVEPSLQAAFVEYGGNRHGFLAFSEIHPDYFRIPISDREALLADERARSVAESNGGAEGDATADPLHDPRDSDDNAEFLSTEREAAEADASDEGDNPPADGNGGSVVEDRSIETVGGDEVEETRSRNATRNRRSYKIQEVVKRRQIMLVQVTKEERGNKGAALTTFLSLAGRYCVLMPNTPRGGGISRKIANPKERKRMKAILDELELPEGMAVIVRTAGLERTKTEIKRDLDYLLRLWDSIRETTLQSTAPTLIHEEANLIKRAIRDLHSKDIEEIHVAGDEGYRTAKEFMRMLVPSHARKVQPYKDETIPLFHRYQIESQIDAMHSATVQLRSGGYIVINPTEALVAIDVNSGRSTRERNIEETAYRTNLEAADEVARQLRLRDLAGLIVIDFIDMEQDRHINAVERRLKDALRHDRARIQIGRISPFGLLEMSRQRLRPSLIETHFETCSQCQGSGLVRSVSSAALHVLRAIEEEGIRQRSAEIEVALPTRIAMYILNDKRAALTEIEQRYRFDVLIADDDSLIAPDYRLRTTRARGEEEDLGTRPAIDATRIKFDVDEDEADVAADVAAESGEPTAEDGEEKSSRRRRRPRRGRRRRDDEAPVEETTVIAAPDGEEAGEAVAEDTAVETRDDAVEAAEDSDGQRRRRRRGKRGGRRRSGTGEQAADETAVDEPGTVAQSEPAAETSVLAAEPAAEETTAAEDQPVTAADIEAEAAEETPKPKRRARRPRKTAKTAEAEAAVAAPVADREVGKAEPAPPAPEPARELEPVSAHAGNGSADAEQEPADATVAATEIAGQTPRNPRRGWWRRVLDS